MEVGELISIVNIHKLKSCDVLYDTYKRRHIMILFIECDGAHRFQGGMIYYLDENGNFINEQIDESLYLDDRYRYLCNASETIMSLISKINLKSTYTLVVEEDYNETATIYK